MTQTTAVSPVPQTARKQKNNLNKPKPIREILITLAALFFIIPVIWVTISSFKSAGELFNFPPTLLPTEPTLNNYTQAFSYGSFGRYTLNTFFVATASMLIAILTNSMAAFALAKYRFKGRELLFMLTLATIMIPLQVIMVPIFIILTKMHLVNSLWGIIIPPAASPTGVFMLRQYMLSIPDELLEAARIDGASDWQIYWRIIMPLSVPALATLGIFSFTWRWNDFIWPFIVLSSESKATLQLALQRMSQSGVEWNIILAATVITMLPILIVFLLLQRYFLSDLTAGGVKG